MGRSWVGVTHTILHGQPGPEPGMEDRLGSGYKTEWPLNLGFPQCCQLNRKLNLMHVVQVSQAEIQGHTKKILIKRCG